MAPLKELRDIDRSGDKLFRSCLDERKTKLINKLDYSDMDINTYGLTLRYVLNGYACVW